MKKSIVAYVVVLAGVVAAGDVSAAKKPKETSSDPTANQRVGFIDGTFEEQGRAARRALALRSNTGAADLDAIAKHLQSTATSLGIWNPKGDVKLVFAGRNSTLAEMKSKSTSFAEMSQLVNFHDPAATIKLHLFVEKKSPGDVFEVSVTREAREVVRKGNTHIAVRKGMEPELLLGSFKLSEMHDANLVRVGGLETFFKDDAEKSFPSYYGYVIFRLKTRSKSRIRLDNLEVVPGE